VKKIAILGLIVLLIVLLGGCARLKTKNYAPPTWAEVTDEYLEKFVGKNISEAQKVFGYKYTTNQLDETRKAYIWEMDRQMGTLLTSTKTVHCNWSFITDPKGKILDTQRIGYCPDGIKIQ
jgi:hypothetical protein